MMNIEKNELLIAENFDLADIKDSIMKLLPNILILSSNEMRKRDRLSLAGIIAILLLGIIAFVFSLISYKVAPFCIFLLVLASILLFAVYIPFIDRKLSKPLKEEILQSLEKVETCESMLPIINTIYQNFVEYSHINGNYPHDVYDLTILRSNLTDFLFLKDRNILSVKPNGHLLGIDVQGDSGYVKEITIRVNSVKKVDQKNSCLIFTNWENPNYVTEYIADMR